MGGTFIGRSLACHGQDADAAAAADDDDDDEANGVTAATQLQP